LPPAAKTVTVLAVNSNISAIMMNLFMTKPPISFLLLKTKINSAINLYKIERLKAEMVTKEKI